MRSCLFLSVQETYSYSPSTGIQTPDYPRLFWFLLIPQNHPDFQIVMIWNGYRISFMYLQPKDFDICCMGNHFLLLVRMLPDTGISDRQIKLGQTEFNASDAKEWLLRYRRFLYIKGYRGRSFLSWVTWWAFRNRIGMKKENINIMELQSGSRRKHITQIRAKLAIQLVEDKGISMAEAGRQLGVSTSAISKIIARDQDKWQ